MLNANTKMRLHLFIGCRANDRAIISLLFRYTKHHLYVRTYGDAYQKKNIIKNFQIVKVSSNIIRIKCM